MNALVAGADAIRTLSDADVEAVARRVASLLRRPPERRPKEPVLPLEVVAWQSTDAELARAAIRTANSNVMPENADKQDMPEPMLKALLAHWRRTGAAK